MADKELGGLLDKMPAAQFWWLHAALVAAAGGVFFVVRLFFGGILRGEPSRLDAAAVVTADAGEIP